MKWFVYDPSGRDARIYDSESTAIRDAKKTISRLADNGYSELAKDVIVGRISHRAVLVNAGVRKFSSSDYKLQPVEPAGGGDA